MKIKHYWATIESWCPDKEERIETLVVVKDTQCGKYTLCGAWEGFVSPHELEIIGEIAPPEEYEDMELYYGYE